MLHVVVLAGGSGTRFWPKSRRSRPKQLLGFGGSRSLLAETVDRVEGLVPAERVWIVTNAEYADQVREQVPAVPAAQVIGEPAGRDTAAAIGLGTRLVEAVDPDATVVVLPADQRIQPADEFQRSMRVAADALERDGERLVVFGIEATEPATGYGYIERGERLSDDEGEVYDVTAFREKPDAETAREYLASKRFFWNAGIFAYKAAYLRHCIARLLPDLDAGLGELAAFAGTPAFADELASRYPSLPAISIDYGVMEKADARSVVATRFAWDDVGSWAALARNFEANGEGNVVLGASVTVDSKDNLVDAGDGVVALLGVEGLVVVHTPDATLVCPRSEAERVKELLAKIRGDDELDRFA